MSSLLSHPPDNLSVSESLNVSDSLFTSLYGRELWSKWRLWKHKLGFGQERVFVAWILEFLEERFGEEDEEGSGDGRIVTYGEGERSTVTATCQFEGEGFEENLQQSNSTRLYHPPSDHAVVKEEYGGNYEGSGASDKQEEHYYSDADAKKCRQFYPALSETIAGQYSAVGGGGGSRVAAGPLTCDQCHRRFSQHATYARHVRSCHRDLRHACLYCDKTFSQKGNLHTHVKSLHHKVRFPCARCGKVFTHQSNLSAHTKRCPRAGAATSLPRHETGGAGGLPRFAPDNETTTQPLLIPGTSEPALTQ